MVNKFFRLGEFVVACCGPGSLFYVRHWFNNVLHEGTEVPDETHTVLVTNHDGIYRYITATQSAQYDRLIYISIALVIVFFILCYRQKRRLDRADSHKL